MTSQDFLRIERQLAPSFPELIIRGSKMVMIPAGSTLRGVHFDRTSDKHQFYLHVFAMPLYIPSEFVYLTYGFALQSLSGPQWHQSPDLVERISDAMRTDALPWLNEMSDLQRLLAQIEVVVGKTRILGGNVSYERDLAFTLIYLGRYEDAIAVLESVASYVDPRVKWAADTGRQCEIMLALVRSNPEAALEQLKKWQDEFSLKFEVI